MHKEHHNSPMKVLLSEDDAEDRNIFVDALNQIPVETQLIIVKDGEQLMNYLSLNLNNLPDVLFLDLSMPRKTGFECLVEIKENNDMKKIPVIIFTTSYTRGIGLELNLINTLTNIGALDYIRKPAEFEHLKSSIQRALLKVIENSAI